MVEILDPAGVSQVRMSSFMLVCISVKVVFQPCGIVSPYSPDPARDQSRQSLSPRQGTAEGRYFGGVETSGGSTWLEPLMMQELAPVQVWRERLPDLQRRKRKQIPLKIVEGGATLQLS